MFPVRKDAIAALMYLKYVAKVRHVSIWTVINITSDVIKRISYFVYYPFIALDVTFIY